MTKNELVQSVKEGKWDRLIKKETSRILPLFNGMPTIDISDLEQEAWLTLLHACDEYDPNKSKFITYAVRSIRNNLLGIFKKYKREDNNLSVDLLNEKFEEADSSKGVSAKIMIELSYNQKLDFDTQHDYSVIFGGLTMEENKLLNDYFVEGQSYRELAKQYNVSYVTIFKRIRTITEKLSRAQNNNNY